MRNRCLILTAALLAWGAGSTRAEVAAGGGDSDRPRLVLEPRGFSSFVGRLEYSPDGTTLAAAGTDGTVRIWDVRRRELRQTLRGELGKGFDGLVTALAFAPDGRALVVGVQSPTAEGAIRVYETADYSRIAQLLPGHPKGGVAEIEFSADGKYAITAGFDNSIILWDWPGRRPLLRDTLSSRVAYVGFPIDAPLAIALQDTGPPKLWSAPHGMERGRLGPEQVAQLHPGGAKGLDDDLARVDRMITAVGKLPAPHGGRVKLRRLALRQGLALLGGEGKDNGRDVFWVGLWSLTGTVRPVGRLHYASYRPTALALSPDGRRAAQGDALGGVALWETGGDQAESPITGEGRPVYSVEFVGPGQLAFGTTPYGPGQWGLNRYADLEMTFDIKGRTLAPLDRRAPVPKRLQQGQRVLRLDAAGAGHGQGLSLLLGDRLACRYALPPLSTAWCYGLLAAPGADFADPVVIGQYNSALTSHDPTTMMCRRTFVGHLGTITDFAESADGRLLATASTDGTIRVWSLANWKRLALPDFDYDSSDGAIHHIVPGGVAEKAGIRVGDRWLKLDGIEAAIHEDNILRGRWTYRVGQRVSLDLERAGRPYSVALALPPTGDVAEPLLSLFVARDGEWVAWTPRGFYDASLNGDRFVGWHVNRGRDKAADFFPAQKFRKTLFRPDIIGRIVETGDIDRAIADAGAGAIADPREPTGFTRLEPPSVRIIEPAPGTTVQSGEATVRAEVRAPGGRPVRRVVFRAIQGAVASRHVDRGEGDAAGGVRTVSRVVQLQPGSNKIEVVAADDDTESLPATVTVECSTRRPSAAPLPKLFGLSVGVSTFVDPRFNLKFAHLDAQAFADSWKVQEGKLYASIEFKILQNEEATKKNIEEAMQWLATTPGERDVAVFFVSSHGLLTPKGNYFLATHEIDEAHLNATGVKSTDLTYLADELGGRLLVFADTCFSGSIGRFQARGDDPMRDLVSDSMGAIVFAASQPRETAEESPRLGHGAFTRAYLDILADPASDLDRPPDGFLSVRELGFLLDRRVAALTKRRQRLSTPKAIATDFNLIQLRP